MTKMLTQQTMNPLFNLLQSVNERIRANAEMFRRGMVKDLKVIYRGEDGIFHIKNYTTGDDYVLCDNIRYARDYSSLYGISIRY